MNYAKSMILTEFARALSFKFCRELYNLGIKPLDRIYTLHYILPF